MRVTSCVTAAALAVASASAAQLDVGPEFQVNTYTTGRQATPAVAVHGDGGFTVAYEIGDQYSGNGPDGSATGVFLRHFDHDGASVGGEQQVNEFTRFAQERPDVAGRADGSFVVVWESGCFYGTGDCGPDGAAQGVAMRRFDADAQAQGPETVVNEFTLGKQRHSAVAAAPGGAFVVVWTSHSYDYPVPGRDENGVFARRFAADGSPASAEFRVNAEPPYTQFEPDVATDAAGNFVVVWREYAYIAGSYYNRVFGQRYDATGAALGGQFAVAADTSSWARSPRVATADDGRFVVVWDQFEYARGGYSDIRAQRYTADGTPAGPVFQVNTYTTYYQSEPSIAADASGNFVVTWTSFAYTGDSQDGDRSGIFAQPFAHDGAPLGSEMLVNVFTTSSQREPAIAANAAGEFVVAWTSGPYYVQSFPQDGSGDGVFARRLALRACTTAPECEDANPCTIDACEGQVCLNRRQAGCCTTAAECSDGDACTDDVCADTACQHPAVSECVPCQVSEDCGNPGPCTIATCDQRLGRCVFEPVSNCCVTATDCDDQQACTADACNQSNQCTFTPLPDCKACTADAECQTGCLAGAEACTDGRCVSPSGCPLVELDDAEPLGPNGKLLARVVIPADVPGKGRIKVVIAALAGPPDAGTSAVRRCREGKRLGRVKAALDPGSETNLLLALDKKAQRCLTGQDDGVLEMSIAVKLKRKRSMLLERTEQRIWRQ